VVAEPLNRSPRPLRIGLTGGIGSGKSTVAALLVEHGALLVDSDAIARELTAAGGRALPPIAAAFGTWALGGDGALDRAAMRERVFAEPEQRRRLEAILHPMIGEECNARAAGATGAAVVFDVPLLAESGHWRDRVDRVLVVDCSEETQVQRVMQRSGWTDATVRQVIAQQAPRALRRSVADAVIHNDGLSLQALHAEVDALWERWMG
jgi:dephospho-CoA kinase